MLRVATLNQYQPGLSSDDLSDVGEPVGPGGVGGSKAPVWEALRGWGQRLYRKADIVFLTEVRHEPHVRFLTQPDVSGLRHYVVMQAGFYTDLAILSRYPLSDARPIRVVGGGDNNILAATVAIEDVPHLLIAAHWYHYNTSTSTIYWRREAAQQMLDLIRAANMPTLVGGDLNVVSGFGSDGITGSAPNEYVMLSAVLSDVCKAIVPTPSDCSNQRIDYIFFKGDYEPVEFNAHLFSEPSDHGFVIVSLKRRGDIQRRVRSHAPVTAVSQRTDELLVAGITDEGIENSRLMYARWAPNSGGWRGWHPLDSASGPPESFIGSAIEDGRAYVLFIGPDGWVYHKWRGADRQWSIWWPVGNSNVPALNGVPGGAVHAVSCQPGMLHVLYTNGDGRILVARRDTAGGGSWPEHQGVLGGATLPGGHVTAVSRRPGQIDLFTAGTNGSVYTAAWNAQDGWRGWWPIGGLMTRPGTYIAAVSRSIDHLDIFVADVDGRTMSAAWEPQFGWRGWWHIQGGRTGSGGYVTAVSRSADKLDIFTTGTDWRVYTAAWEPGRNWGGWWRINDARSQSPVWPVSRSADKLDIFFVDPDGKVQTAAWEPGRTWGGPWTINEGWSLPG
jgi:endonuclease/exonuclease/phosphatase (EEP) superfamily protein YafD